ncbi:tetratricopeptide repeat protein [Flavobacteriales bacterium]|nr:tetratricopeptide repeat protein [Flavobacteriales bacterium]
MKNLFLLLVFLSLHSQSLYSNKADSLRLTWENEKLTDSLRFGALDEFYNLFSLVFPDSTLKVLDYYHDLAISKGADRQVYRAAVRKGNILRHQDLIEEARTHYYEALIVAKEMNNARLEAIIIGNFGNLHLDQGEYFESIKRYNEAKIIFSTVDDKLGEARMLNGIGAINSQIGNDDIALVHYEKALNIYKELDTKEISYSILNSTTILMNIGLLYTKDNLLIKAEASFLEALKILKPYNYKIYILGCYNTLAHIYLELNQVEKSLLYANKGFDIAKELDINREILRSKILLATINYQNNKSIQQLVNILEQVSENGSLEMKRGVYELLYIGYKFQDKLDMSLKMYELFNLYNDSIQKSIESYAVARETVKSEYEKILFEAKLNSEIEKNDLKVTQIKNVVTIIITSILLILLLVYFIFLNNKKNNKKRDALLDEIKSLKENKVSPIVDPKDFELSKQKIDDHLKRVLNETDWKVLLILLDNPMVLNKEIADKSNMSLDGISSSLRRMYDYFEVKDTKYKKISLIHSAIKISNASVINFMEKSILK